MNLIYCVARSTSWVRDYVVEVAASGEEAIQKVQTQAPHGILMDMKMPDMSGVQAYQEIRPLAPHACIIFITAYSELSDAAQIEAPVAVFSKPLELGHLHLLIEQAMQKLSKDQASKA